MSLPPPPPSRPPPPPKKSVPKPVDPELEEMRRLDAIANGMAPLAAVPAPAPPAAVAAPPAAVPAPSASGLPPPPPGKGPPPPKKSAPKPLDPELEEMRRLDAIANGGGGAAAPVPAPAAPPAAVPPPPAPPAGGGPPPPPGKAPPPPKKSVPKPVSSEVDELRKLEGGAAAASPPPPAPAPVPAPPVAAAAAASSSSAPPAPPPPPPPKKAAPPPPPPGKKAAPPPPPPALAATTAAPAVVPPSKLTPPPPPPPPAPPAKVKVAPPPPTPPSKLAATSSLIVTAEEARQRATRLLQLWAPDKVDTIPQLLAEYKGREKQMMSDLVAKHGMEPPAQDMPAVVAKGAAASVPPPPAPAPAKAAGGASSAAAAAEKLSPAATPAATDAAAASPSAAPAAGSAVVASVAVAAADPKALHAMERSVFEMRESSDRREVSSTEREESLHLYYWFRGVAERTAERSAINAMHEAIHRRNALFAAEERARDQYGKEEEVAYLHGIMMAFGHDRTAVILKEDQKAAKRSSKHLAKELTALQEQAKEQMGEIISKGLEAKGEQGEAAAKLLLQTATAQLSTVARTQVEVVQKQVNQLEQRMAEQLASMIVLQQQQQERLGLNKTAFERECELEERDRHRTRQMLDQLQIVEKSAEKERSRASAIVQHFQSLAKAGQRAVVDEEESMRTFLEESERTLRRQLSALFVSAVEGYTQLMAAASMHNSALKRGGSSSNNNNNNNSAVGGSTPAPSSSPHHHNQLVQRQPSLPSASLYPSPPMPQQQQQQHSRIPQMPVMDNGAGSGLVSSPFSYFGNTATASSPPPSSAMMSQRAAGGGLIASASPTAAVAVPHMNTATHMTNTTHYLSVASSTLHEQAASIGRYLYLVLDYSDQSTAARLGLWLAAAGYGSALPSSSSPSPSSLSEQHDSPRRRAMQKERQRAVDLLALQTNSSNIIGGAHHHAGGGLSEGEYLGDTLAAYGWSDLHGSLVGMSLKEMGASYILLDPEDPYSADLMSWQEQHGGAIPTSSGGDDSNSIHSINSNNSFAPVGSLRIPLLTMGERRVLIQKVSKAELLVKMAHQQREENVRAAAAAAEAEEAAAARRVRQQQEEVERAAALAATAETARVQAAALAAAVEEAEAKRKRELYDHQQQQQYAAAALSSSSSPHSHHRDPTDYYNISVPNSSSVPQPQQQQQQTVAGTLESGGSALLTLPALTAHVAHMKAEVFPRHDLAMGRAWERCRQQWASSVAAGGSGGGGGAAVGSLQQQQWHEAWRFAWQHDLKDQTAWERSMEDLSARVAAAGGVLRVPSNNTASSSLLSDPIAEALEQRKALDAASKVTSAGGSDDAVTLPVPHGHRLRLLAVLLQRGLGTVSVPPSFLMPPPAASTAGAYAYASSAAGGYPQQQQQQHHPRTVAALSAGALGSGPSSPHRQYQQYHQYSPHQHQQQYQQQQQHYYQSGPHAAAASVPSTYLAGPSVGAAYGSPLRGGGHLAPQPQSQPHSSSSYYYQGPAHSSSPIPHRPSPSLAAKAATNGMMHQGQQQHYYRQ